MKKFVIMLFTVNVVFMSCSLCCAAEKNGILIISPVEFKTQDFLNIATEAFGKQYDISQGIQDSWASYCWDKGFVDSDPMISKETLADFASKASFDKIIFVIFKDVNKTAEDKGAVFSFGIIKKKIRYRTAIQSRVVVMNHNGETLKVFEESHTDASLASELRANRGAFKGLCKHIATRLQVTNN